MSSTTQVSLGRKKGPRERGLGAGQTARSGLGGYTLLSNVGFENTRAENGDVYVWLPPDVIAKLHALRGRGQSYSDVILQQLEVRYLKKRALI